MLGKKEIHATYLELGHIELSTYNFQFLFLL